MSNSRRRPALYYVDHTSRFARNSGIQRCVRSLARALIEAGQPLIPVIWNRRSQRLASAGPAALHHLARWNGPAANSWSTWTRGADDPRWLLVPELVRGASNPSRRQLLDACRPLQLRDAWLFHDAIPLHQASLYGPAAERVASDHGRYMAALGEATLVFCNSRHSRGELSRFLQTQQRTPTAQLRSLILADQFGSERAAPPPARRRGEPLKMLCVSTLEPRKNHKGLVKALAWLHSQAGNPWRMTLVGWPAEPAIREFIERGQRIGLPLHWVDHVDDDALLALYRDADLTVFPSLEEGFGLPVAESLWQRRPCLCSGEGALGERAAGGGCETVNTRRWQALAQGLDTLLNKPERRLALQQQLERRRFRSWTDVAEEMLDTIERVAPAS